MAMLFPGDFIKITSFPQSQIKALKQSVISSKLNVNQDQVKTGDFNFSINNSSVRKH